MSAYSSALFNVSLAGPTLFAPVINAAAQIASQSLDQLKYFVLLIITVSINGLHFFIMKLSCIVSLCASLLLNPFSIFLF